MVGSALLVDLRSRNGLAGPMSKPGDRVEELWAYLVIDKDDIEGIISAYMPALGNVPLVGADKERMDSFRFLAEETAKTIGVKVQLVRFHGREVLEEFE